jgi:hypothetical protein
VDPGVDGGVGVGVGMAFTLPALRRALQ